MVPAILGAFLVGCGSDDAKPTADNLPAVTEVSVPQIVPRFLLSGWINPIGEDADLGPFAETLRAFVITSQEELDEFLGSIDLLRTVGNLASLSRTDLEQDIMLGIYYLWRPLKGDPLSILGVSSGGDEVVVDVELVEDPLGDERPFLLGPVHISAVDRKELPTGTPVEFVFSVNGKEAARLTRALE